MVGKRWELCYDHGSGNLRGGSNANFKHSIGTKCFEKSDCSSVCKRLSLSDVVKHSYNILYLKFEIDGKEGTRSNTKM